MKIGEFLVKYNYVTQENVNKALELQKTNKNQYIGEILVKMNVITREYFIKCFDEYELEVIKESHE